MRNFAWHTPNTPAEAIALLNTHGDDARAFAGGTALMLALRQRLVSPSQVVSLKGIEALRGISFEGSRLRIGGLTTHAQIAAHPLVREHCPLLANVAANLANPQVRNQGTLGGNLCYADPATDPPSTLLALDARVELQGPRGIRTLSMSEFLIDYFTTALQPNELLLAVSLPLEPGRVTASYRFLRHAAEHRPLINCAFSAVLEDGRLRDVRLAVGAVTPVAHRARAAESLLQFAAISESLIAEVARLVSETTPLISDGRSTDAYRQQMLEVVVRRTLSQALSLPADR